jgi:hypothetical protein
MAQFPASKMRWLSGILLAVAVLMLILGETVLAKSLAGKTFVFYWLGCFVCTGLAAIAAILDFFSLQRRARIQQKEIMEKVFRDVAKDDSHRRS